jgi:ABC-type amino acid transport system permease subunit
MNYTFDFGSVLYYMPAFYSAILVTLQLTVLSCIVGTLVGLPIAGLLALPRPISDTVSFLVDFLRAVPDLALFFLFYYFPYRAALGVEAPPPFVCAVLAMSTILALFSGALFSEAIHQAPRNQMLGLRAIGFSEFQVFRYAVLPAVARQTLPALIAFWIGILKMSSLASVIGVTDVVYVAKIQMAQSFRSLEAWIAVALIYAILVLPIVYFVRSLQRRPWMQRQ